MIGQQANHRKRNKEIIKLFESIPLKKILFIVCAFILITNLIPVPNVIGQPSSHLAVATSTSPNSTNTDSITYLPCIFKDFCTGAAPSPFSVQIAGLSEFPVPAGMSQADADQIRIQEIDAYLATFPILVQAVKDSGAGWARIYIDWAQIQSINPATYDWSFFDATLGQIASAGVQMIATVSNPPTWASPGINSNPCWNRISVDHLTDFNNFLTAVVNRYKVAPYNIHVWEILNEPDAIDNYRCTTGASNYGTHGADYAALLQVAYPAVKAADPTAKVIMGGIADEWFYLPTTDPNQDGSPDGKFYRFFTDDIARNGAANYLDAMNFHYFKDFVNEWQRWTIGNPPTCGVNGANTIRDPNGTPYSAYGFDVVAKGSHFLNRLKTCFNVNKPLWITEVGMHGIDPNSTNQYGKDFLLSRPDLTLENQARYVFMVFARGLSLGTENMTWYALKINSIITPGDYQGLLYDSRDGAKENQPKPAFYAFQTLTSELKGFAFKATLLSSDSAEVYSFTNPCLGTKIVAWANQSTTIPFVINNVKSVQLVYRPQAVAVQNKLIYDGDANDQDGIVNSSIKVPLNVEPVIIQLKP